MHDAAGRHCLLDGLENIPAKKVGEGPAPGRRRARTSTAAGMANELFVAGHSPAVWPKGAARRCPARRVGSALSRIVSTGAHRPVDVGANLAEGMGLAAECGLEVLGEAWVEQWLARRVIG